MKTYLLSIVIAFDRLCAAILGWGYSFTISAHCGSDQKECRFCKTVCKLLNYINPGHCETWAKKEGAIQ